MHAWEQIQKTVDYIEDHLDQILSIEQLANMAHLSQYYYQRLFSRLVGKTVNEYIKARRVAKAKVLLKSSKQRILDIALDVGFQSHESLTRAFKEVYDINPDEYRKSNITLKDFLRPDLSMNYTIVQENVPLIVDDMIVEIRKQLITENEYYQGLSKIIEAEEMNKVGENVMVTLTHEFHDIKHLVPNLTKDGIEIDYFGTDETSGKVKFFVGSESATSEKSEYEQMVLTKGNYYVCSFEAEDFEYLVSDALYKANTYFFEVWLVNQGITMEKMEPYLVQKYFDVETNPRIEIWIKPTI